MKTLVSILLSIMFCAGCACAGSVGNAVQVRIVSDDGYELPTYPVKAGREVRKVYAEAVKGEHYRIEVRNNLDRRVGLVIAVDGRNIISGDKSWLKNSERMYILEPHGTGEFSGWRTGQDRINRFYFTDVPDSYAAAFGDESAMGVIAVVAYPEQRHEPPVPAQLQAAPEFGRNSEGKGTGASDSAPAAKAPSAEYRSKTLARAEKSMERAGTGYGREEYSPSYTVEFEPERRAVESIYVKYEWRSSLCKMGIAPCHKSHPRNPNRLWDDDGYAPPPPGR